MDLLWILTAVSCNMWNNTHRNINRINFRLKINNPGQVVGSGELLSESNAICGGDVVAFIFLGNYVIQGGFFFASNRISIELTLWFTSSRPLDPFDPDGWQKTNQHRCSFIKSGHNRAELSWLKLGIYLRFFDLLLNDISTKGQRYIFFWVMSPLTRVIWLPSRSLSLTF